jgi:hypothetical protein
VIDMAPRIDVLASLKQLRRHHPRQEMATALVDVLPKRLARKIADSTAGPERIADFSDKLLMKVTTDVKQWRIKPNGTEGYRTAEVTLGGVDTSGLLENVRSQIRSGALFHRRGRRCHRTSWRLQLSMGLVVGIRRRPAPLGRFSAMKVFSGEKPARHPMWGRAFTVDLRSGPGQE